MQVTIWGIGTVEMTEHEVAIYFGHEDEMCPPRRDSSELMTATEDDEQEEAGMQEETQAETYEERVAELEAEGCCTSDAQAIAEAEGF